MPEYLCKEDDDEFILVAKDAAEARESAAMYNAVVIRKL